MGARLQIEIEYKTNCNKNIRMKKEIKCNSYKMKLGWHQMAWGGANVMVCRSHNIIYCDDRETIIWKGCHGDPQAIPSFNLFFFAQFLSQVCVFFLIESHQSDDAWRKQLRRAGAWTDQVVRGGKCLWMFCCEQLSISCIILNWSIVAGRKKKKSTVGGKTKAGIWR